MQQQQSIFHCSILKKLQKKNAIMVIEESETTSLIQHNNSGNSDNNNNIYPPLSHTSYNSTADENNISVQEVSQDHQEIMVSPSSSQENKKSKSNNAGCFDAFNSIVKSFAGAGSFALFFFRIFFTNFKILKTIIFLIILDLGLLNKPV